MLALDTVGLTPLMGRTSGRAEVVIGLVDGPVAVTHADLVNENIGPVPRGAAYVCTHIGSMACLHGTSVAAILMARRGSGAPAICPGCTLAVRPVFTESEENTDLPSTYPQEVSAAIVDCIEHGVSCINLSLVVRETSAKEERAVTDALDYAAAKAVLVVAAAGNDATVGSNCITRHPWTIPVVACDTRGAPLNLSTLGASIGTRGLSAPVAGLTSPRAEGQPVRLSGTSIVAPVVTGAIALLWSALPGVAAAEIRFALTRGSVHRRTSVAPPMLNAWRAYEYLARTGGG